MSKPKHLVFMRRSCVLPEKCVFFGDKIYPISNCIMTPYTAAQLARKEDRVKRKCEKIIIVIFATTGLVESMLLQS